jgi:hypothetical protein
MKQNERPEGEYSSDKFFTISSRYMRGVEVPKPPAMQQVETRQTFV